MIRVRVLVLIPLTVLTLAAGDPALEAQSILYLVREGYPENTLLKYEKGELSNVGSIGFDDVRGLAHDPTNDTLYAVSRGASPRLITVDPRTGTGTEVSGQKYLPDWSNSAEISADVDGTILGLGHENDQSTIDSLLHVDKATGVATVVGTWAGPLLSGIAIDRRYGTVFGTTYDGDLYTINPADASVRLVGSITGTNGGVALIAFDWWDGVLYGMTNNNQLVSIDLNTLQATEVRQFVGAEGFYSMGFRPSVILGDGFESGDTSAWSSTSQ